MDLKAVKRRRRRLILIFAAMGFLVAAVIWGLSKLTDSAPPNPKLFPLWLVLTLLCPPSLLTFPLIDVEPSSPDFNTTWLVIALLNAGLYTLIAMIVGWLRWAPDQKPEE